MNTNTLHVQLTGHARLTANLESVTTAADVAVWRSAAEVLRERTYDTVRVRVDWDPLVLRDHADEGPVQFEVQVISPDDRDGERDAPSYAALFFHDAFLMLNLAVPGSFGGTITILPGGAELALSSRMFEYAWSTASSSIEPLPLADVVAWYDALQLGTQQVATDGVAKALFILLHLARRDEDESTSVVRLGQALEALDVGASPEFFAFRNAIVHGAAPVIHPLADDALDEQVDAESLELVDASDYAAIVVVGALQARIRASRQSRL